MTPTSWSVRYPECLVRRCYVGGGHHESLGQSYTLIVLLQDPQRHCPELSMWCQLESSPSSSRGTIPAWSFSTLNIPLTLSARGTRTCAMWAAPTGASRPSALWLPLPNDAWWALHVELLAAHESSAPLYDGVGKPFTVCQDVGGSSCSRVTLRLQGYGVWYRHGCARCRTKEAAWENVRFFEIGFANVVWRLFILAADRRPANCTDPAWELPNSKEMFPWCVVRVRGCGRPTCGGSGRSLIGLA